MSLRLIMTLGISSNIHDSDKAKFNSIFHFVLIICCLRGVYVIAVLLVNAGAVRLRH